MSDNILSHITQLLKQNPQNFTIVEDQIDLEIQMEYFKMSRTIKDDTNTDINQLMSDCLSAPDASVIEIKRLLVYLASVASVDSYRKIEKFYNDVSDESLRAWCALALKECRMMMESTLLDERQVLISTGMGGKNGKLRYFIVLFSRNGDEFNDTQKKIIRSEFEFTMGNERSDIEKLEFDKRFAKITSLIPLDVEIKNTVQKAVVECNIFGDFINNNFIITNVKPLKTEEIEDILNSNDDDNDDNSDVEFPDIEDDDDSNHISGTNINDLLN